MNEKASPLVCLPTIQSTWAYVVLCRIGSSCYAGRIACKAHDLLCQIQQLPRCVAKILDLLIFAECNVASFVYIFLVNIVSITILKHVMFTQRMDKYTVFNSAVFF